ncbi:metal-dependent hydrolase [Bacillus sp. FSL K6-3431]|uniref:metal-dependent hydrolase n=1 Tax=Bacillus sp. FSL K6-3431 TaxID=2921500 RepID=UPI0030F82FD2
MDGKTHFIVGGIVGIGVGKYVGVDLPTAVSLTLLGGCVGLVPDLDVKGTLSKRISLNKKWLILLLGLFGLLLIAYSFDNAPGIERWIGLGAGIVLLTFPSVFVKQKMMLLLTGLAALMAGFAMQSIWLIMLGIYISIASRLPHRSLTHSIIGLTYFSGIGYYLEQDLQVEGIMLVCILSYASHLVLDMKWLPGNRKGIKLFQPFFKIEM